MKTNGKPRKRKTDGERNMTAGEEFKREYLCDDISVSYTLKIDDITKGEKPPMSPYASRKESFSGGFAPLTKTRLTIKRDGGGYLISARSASDELSQFGLNVPFNFMGKKNGGGWRNQFLFNSPYSSSDNGRIFCYFASPNGMNFVLLFLSRADGWKMDYSPFSGGQYFDNFQALAHFDRAYKPRSSRFSRNVIEFFVRPVENYDEALTVVSEKLGLPVAYYDRNYCRIGDDIRIRIKGEADYVTSRGKRYEVTDGEARVTAEKYGLTTVTPYRAGKKGLDCVYFACGSIEDLYSESVRSVSREDLATGDGNLCEWKCHVSAILRYEKIFGASACLSAKIKSDLALATARDESLAKPRQTVFYKARKGFPPYHVYASARIQEQFFAVGIFIDAYELTAKKKYYEYAVRTLDCALATTQKENGGIFVRFGDGRERDYTTVCCPLINVADAAFLARREGDTVRAARYEAAAAKMAEFVYNRGDDFPTETDDHDFAEPFVEEGSISCSALTLLYYCAKIRREEKYVARAKELLDLHDSWVIKTHIAPMFFSSLRWWETKWEGDRDGNALCCGHAWTIWRAEADFWYYKLTGDREYLEKARCGFMSNLSKIDARGRSYACYQPDYITGGGFTDKCEQVAFRIAKGFPKQTDSGLSRYVWTRAVASILTESEPF